MCWKIEFRVVDGEIEERDIDIHDMWSCVYSNTNAPAGTWWKPLRKWITKEEALEIIKKVEDEKALAAV